MIIAYRDNRTPLFAKILVGITVAYLLSPVDLIPDFIPILGLLDDLLIVPLLINLSFKMIPAIVLADARLLAKTNPERIKKTNWIFAGLIICLWAVLGLVVFHYFFR